MRNSYIIRPGLITIKGNIFDGKLIKKKFLKNPYVVLHIFLAETIKKLDNFILKGADLCDHTKVFLWRTLNYYKQPMLCTLS